MQVRVCVHGVCDGQCVFACMHSKKSLIVHVIRPWAEACARPLLAILVAFERAS